MRGRRERPGATLRVVRMVALLTAAASCTDPTGIKIRLEAFNYTRVAYVNGERALVEVLGNRLLITGTVVMPPGDVVLSGEGWLLGDEATVHIVGRVGPKGIPAVGGPESFGYSVTTAPLKGGQYYVRVFHVFEILGNRNWRLVSQDTVSVSVP